MLAMPAGGAGRVIADAKEVAMIPIHLPTRRILLIALVAVLCVTTSLLRAPRRGDAQEAAPARAETVALAYRAVAFWNQPTPDDGGPLTLPSDRVLRQHAYPPDTPDAVGNVFANHHLLHAPGRPGLHGPFGLARLATEHRAAFPDLHLTVVDLIADGGGVAIRWRAHGTHRGTFQGVSATGVEATWEGLALFRMANGRVVETWFYPDTPGLLRQLQAA